MDLLATGTDTLLELRLRTENNPLTLPDDPALYTPPSSGTGRMVTIALLTKGTRGDVVPVLWLIRALHNANPTLQFKLITHKDHETLITSETSGGSFTLEFVPLASSPIQRATRHQDGMLGREKLKIVSDLERALRACADADMLLFSLFSLEGYHIAEHYRIPCIAFGFHVNPGMYHTSQGSDWMSHMFDEPWATWRRKRLSLPASTPNFSCPPLLIAVDATFFPKDSMWPPSAQCTGFWTVEDLETPSAQDCRTDAIGIVDSCVAEGLNVIYVCFGSMWGCATSALQRETLVNVVLQVATMAHSNRSVVVVNCCGDDTIVQTFEEARGSAVHQTKRPRLAEETLSFFESFSAIPPPSAPGSGSPSEGSSTNNCPGPPSGLKPFPTSSSTPPSTASTTPPSSINSPCPKMPENLYVLPGPLPHDILLPKVHVMIHHGGCGTVASCLRNGVPQFVVPFMHDQLCWGELVEYHGLGYAPYSMTRLTEFWHSEQTRVEDELRKVIDECTGAGTIRENAQRMKRRLEGRAPGLQVACNQVLELLPSQLGKPATLKGQPGE